MQNKFILFIIIVFFASCESKKDKNLNIIIPQAAAGECKILSNTRSDGQQYQYIFKDKKLLNILGFLDFDTFTYDNNGKISKGTHTKNPNAQILFNFNSQSLLKTITFEGKDSQGKSFSFPTTIKHNTINKIESLTLNWPTFDGKIETKFTYDIKGNVKFISAFIDDEWKTILENTEYDDKPSPYKNQELGQIMSYYMVYSLLTGGNNFTYFLNANNVKKAVVTKGNSKIYYNFEYKYNAQGYPSEVDYTKTENNRPTPFSEKFSYDCDK
jgi:hypothetical protein